MTIPPDFTSPEKKNLASLLDDLKAHFEHELELMEGNYGLTGDEDQEEMEISGEMAEWQEIRNAKAFVLRIEAERSRI